MKESYLIDLPKITDPRGNLSFIEGQEHIPFDIARVFWTYDVPGGQTRGGHAYRSNEEVIIALSGSFDVVVVNSEGSKRFSLNRSYSGLYLPALTWRHLENFSTNAIALTLASKGYDVQDYIRDIKEFEKIQNGI